jgi:hypothetical protein
LPTTGLLSAAPVYTLPGESRRHTSNCQYLWMKIF